MLSWDDIILEPASALVMKILDHALIGMLVFAKSLKKHTFHSTIRVVWSFVTSLTIEDLGPNTFLFTFPSPLEKYCVSLHCPWNFKGYYMVFKEWPLGLSLQEIDLIHFAFWI